MGAFTGYKLAQIIVNTLWYGIIMIGKVGQKNRSKEIIKCSSTHLYLRLLEQYFY
jgi:hypothetical protein